MSSMLAHAHALLRDVFGYERFRAPQDEVIATLMAGGDALVLMPTGGGKSLCYQIPAIARPGTGIVVSPLIALMQDQVAALKQAGVHAAYLNSALTAEAARAERDRRGALRRAGGALFPARIYAALGVARAFPGRAAYCAHRHGRRTDAPRDHRASRPRTGPRLHQRIRPSEHPLSHRAGGWRARRQRARSVIALHPYRARGRCRHRLLPVAQARG